MDRASEQVHVLDRLRRARERAGAVGRLTRLHMRVDRVARQDIGDVQRERGFVGAVARIREAGADVGGDLRCHDQETSDLYLHAIRIPSVHELVAGGRLSRTARTRLAARITTAPIVKRRNDCLFTTILLLCFAPIIHSPGPRIWFTRAPFKVCECPTPRCAVLVLTYWSSECESCQAIRVIIQVERFEKPQIERFARARWNQKDSGISGENCRKRQVPGPAPRCRGRAGKIGVLARSARDAEKPRPTCSRERVAAPATVDGMEPRGFEPLTFWLPARCSSS